MSAPRKGQFSCCSQQAFRWPLIVINVVEAKFLAFIDLCYFSLLGCISRLDDTVLTVAGGDTTIASQTRQRPLSQTQIPCPLAISHEAARFKVGRDVDAV